MTEINRKVWTMKGRRDLLTGKLNDMQKMLEYQRSEGEILEGIRKLLEALGKTAEATIKSFVEPLVTEALDYVFAKDLRFVVEFVTKRNQTEAYFYFTNRTGDKVLGNPEDVHGCGILDVVALVLRISVAQVLKCQGPIVLDEPTKHVDDTHNARCGSLLNALSRRFNRQIVMVTHSQELAGYADKTYSVSQNNGVSNVQEGIA